MLSYYIIIATHTVNVILFIEPYDFLNNFDSSDVFSLTISPINFIFPYIIYNRC